MRGEPQTANPVKQMALLEEEERGGGRRVELGMRGEALGGGEGGMGKEGVIYSCEWACCPQGLL